MKVHLLYKDKDLAITDNIYKEKIIEENSELFKNLELDNVIKEMGKGDSLIEDVSRFILSTPLSSVTDITYRQESIKDALNNKEVIKALYKISNETSEEVRLSRYSLDTQFLSSIFSASVGLIQIYLKRFKEIVKLIDKEIKNFKTDSFISLFTSLKNDFTDSFIKECEKFLLHMNEGEGTLIKCEFGSFLQGFNYTYCKNDKLSPLMRFAPTYTLPEMDYISAEDFSDRRDRAINKTANILAKAAKNFESFFEELKYETSFLVGCINLYDTLSSLNLPYCTPILVDTFENKCEVKEMYDISLALYKKEGIVTNDLTSDKKLIIITGANQGGKTTFLRSIGQNLLLAKCGLLVASSSFNFPLKNNIYTHFKKEEDNNMNSGKLDEEMKRMDNIISKIKKGDIVLSNESFSSTNEREGSEIFREITKALVEHNINVISVTHMYEYATSFKEEDYVHYLRAEHTQENGITYKIKNGEADETAFGYEIYSNVFKD